jgi:hypothetical protein
MHVTLCSTYALFIPSIQNSEKNRHIVNFLFKISGHLSKADYCLGETPLTKMVKTPFHESMSSSETPLATRPSIRRREKSWIKKMR